MSLSNDQCAAIRNAQYVNPAVLLGQQVWEHALIRAGYAAAQAASAGPVAWRYKYEVEVDGEWYWRTRSEPPKDATGWEPLYAAPPAAPAAPAAPVGRRIECRNPDACCWPHCTCPPAAPDRSET